MRMGCFVTFIYILLHALYDSPIFAFSKVIVSLFFIRFSLSTPFFFMVFFMVSVMILANRTVIVPDISRFSSMFSFFSWFCR